MNLPADGQVLEAVHDLYLKALRLHRELGLPSYVAKRLRQYPYFETLLGFAAGDEDVCWRYGTVFDLVGVIETCRVVGNLAFSSNPEMLRLSRIPWSLRQCMKSE